MTFSKDQIKQLQDLFEAQDIRIVNFLDERFAAQDARIDIKFAEQDKRIDIKFAEQDKYINAKFEKQDKRIDTKFAEQRSEIMRDIVVLLRQELAPIKARIEQLFEMENEDIKALAHEIETLKKRLAQLEFRVGKFKTA